MVNNFHGFVVVCLFVYLLVCLYPHEQMLKAACMLEMKAVLSVQCQYKPSW